MKVYLVTDTHLGHDKMVEYCGRPENHSEIILEGLKRIPLETILIHLGDVCIGRDEYWHERIMNHTHQCGTHILIRGNHDHKTDTWYLNRGWDFICEQFTNNYFGKKITFSHKPVEIAADVDLNIHGHFHNSAHEIQEPYLTRLLTPKHKLLAIENTGLKPVNLEKFINS